MNARARIHATEVIHKAAGSVAEIHNQCHRKVCAGCEVRRDILDVLRSVADVIGEKSSRKADATPALTVFRASHDSIVMGLYTTREAAREHCEAEERRSWPGRTGLTFAWIPDDSDPLSPEELSVFAGQNDESVTGYVVTPLEPESA